MKKPQTLSLQDQLLKAGLANETKAKQVKADKRKQGKLQRNQGVEVVDEIKLDLEQARVQQAERDRELNQLRKQAEEHKALLAQIKQMVEQNSLAQDANGVAYQFTDGSKVKSVYVPEKTRTGLIEGRAGIIKLENAYHIVPRETAEKIAERDAGSVLVLNAASVENGLDDPYAEFQVPDDLIW
ncbi:DUF2058 domain-containing protein [Methylomonas paludis]|uniref:DUF2058 domain-containing protein n=1 Tax=Methylomonas paludis TaxID=1173101 RepID=A0A975R925_9GAMM|nr:DUF2058 domain-containing protein [Methylomonas paludis]QWF71000.1 DUF2058 domain-containing protein [Methylomonas paludis]